MVSILTSEDFVLGFPLVVNESDLPNHPWDSERKVQAWGLRRCEFCIVTCEAVKN
jgi:hypothetical protein